MPPAKVTGYSWYMYGSSFLGAWAPVTTNADGTAKNNYTDATPLLDFRYYHCNISNGTTSVDLYVVKEHIEFTEAQNVTAFGTFQSSLTLTITAVDLNYNESTPVSVLASASQPPIPSPPVVTPYLGLLQIKWDGKDSVGNPAPGNLDHLEVYYSTNAVFTADSTTLLGKSSIIGSNGASYLATSLTYGTTYYFKIVLVNQMKLSSVASVAVSGTPQRISGLDISNGQISAAQINFTARDIGGANAYYKATAPTSADGTLKAGDIWYNTASGYITSRYDGTTWQTAPEVGVIAGTKILAGTLTADAVGTNLLITASANIGSAVIDQANISTVSAGSIRAGTMSADVVVGGRFATSLTGARVEMNSLGFQKFDTDGTTKLVSITGSEALLTGTYSTAATGRRIQMGAVGALGRIDFFAPTGTNAFVQAYTEVSGHEAMQFGVALTQTSDQLWNRLNLNNDSGGYTNLRSNRIEFLIGGANNAGGSDSTQQGFFHILETSNYGSTSQLRFQIDKTGMYYVDPNGTYRLQADNTGFVYHDPAGTTRLFIDGTNFSCADAAAHVRMWAAGTAGGMADSAGHTRFYYDANGTSIIYPNGGTGNSIAIAPGNTVQTAWLRLFTDGGYGETLVCTMDSPGTNMRMELKNWDGATWHPFWASGYVTQSDMAAKENIVPFQKSALDMLRPVGVHHYVRKSAPGTTNTRRELGLLAQEAPAEIRVSGEGFEGIDLYGLVSLLTSAVKELHAKVEALEAKK
jgi:hypothetical protein